LQKELGHVIGKDRVKSSPLKVLAVKEFPQPRFTFTTSKNIKQFLGLAGYYKQILPNFSKIAKLLSNLLKKGEKFVWNKAQEKAFREL